MRGLRGVRGAVAIGGALGGLGRVGVALALPTIEGWPLATLLVNVTGALLLGLLLATTDDPRLRALLGTGVLGAWTTFSALAVELETLLRTAPAVAVAYAAVTLAAGLGAARLGRWLGDGRRTGEGRRAGEDHR